MNNTRHFVIETSKMGAFPSRASGILVAFKGKQPGPPQMSSILHDL